MTEQLEQTPIHQALTRPLLLFGADRELVLLSGLLIFLAVFMSLSDMRGFFIALPIGLFVWSLALWGLREVAKRDPHYRQIYIRSTNYDRIILPASTPFRGR